MGEVLGPYLCGLVSSAAAFLRQESRLLPQQVLLDFAGRGLWKRAEDDRLRDFETRHALPAEIDKLCCSHLGARPQRHERAGRLAPVGIWARDDGGLEHCGMAVENTLDL